MGQVITILEQGGIQKGHGRGAGNRGHGRGHGAESIVRQAMEEEEVGAEKEDDNFNAGTSSEDKTEVPTQKKQKKKAVEVVLTPEQEQALCEWLQLFPQIWNTRHENYRKTPEKELLWEEQGQKMGLMGNVIKQCTGALGPSLVVSKPRSASPDLVPKQP